MEHFYQQTIGEDWFTYPQLYAGMVASAGPDSHIVEVGCWKGKSACFMAVEIINSGKKIKFDCVDPWEDSGAGVPEFQLLAKNKELAKNTYATFLANTEPVKSAINVIRLPSVQASKMYADGSLDFVFIDALHDYFNVAMDIAHWWPKLKKGCIMAGHDYDWINVARPVNDFFRGLDIVASEKCWRVRKPVSDADAEAHIRCARLYWGSYA